jgi:hypothetical protein
MTIFQSFAVNFFSNGRASILRSGKKESCFGLLDAPFFGYFYDEENNECNY